jgi:predicted AAA+ superfamily ATPase
MLIGRAFWHGRIEAAWRERPVVWLMGVRRAGKSVLCQTLRDIAYYDCELPRVRRIVEDPQAF